MLSSSNNLNLLDIYISENTVCSGFYVLQLRGIQKTHREILDPLLYCVSNYPVMSVNEGMHFLKHSRIMVFARFF